MSVIKKLHQLQMAVRSLATNADGQTGAAKYPYVTGNKLLGFVRPKMDELGLILTQEIVGITNTPITYPTSRGEKTEMFTSLHLRFTWIDAEGGSTLVNDFYANGMNAWDKGLGSALTYGERYYLMKTFHIATDEDDVDALIKPEALRETQTAPAGQPMQMQQQAPPMQQQGQQAPPSLEQAIADVVAAKTPRDLTAVWNWYKNLYGQNIDFVNAIAESPVNPKKGRSTK